MKLKYYLILTYVLALIFPFLCCGLIIKINKDYNRSTEVKDYIATSVEFSKYEELVSDPEVYTSKAIPEQLQDMKGDEKVVITLYDPKGIALFSTNTDNEYMVSQEYLYQDLNEIQYGGTTYTLKKPVFNSDSEVIGFYEISIARANLRKAINNNLVMSIIACIMALIISVLLIVKYLNKRFNIPVKRVIQGMNDYAKGDTKVHIDYDCKDEIGELCEHFNAMKDEIEEGKQAVRKEQKAKEYMIATISHDLKTPLTAIRAYAEMMRLDEHIDKAKQADYLETILSKCDYMKDMLDDLLTYNLLSMNYQLSMVEVEGQEFCEMLFSGIEATCKDKGITLTIDIEVSDTYKVDVKYMTRVVDNIVSNAIRHTPVNGHIWAGAFSAEAKLPEWVDPVCRDAIAKYPKCGMALIVKNEGNVISEKDKNNLFKPFYQGDEARSKKEHKGVGLGLSISKMIMEKHQGMIEAIPIEGVGNAMLCFLKNASCKEEE